LRDGKVVTAAAVSAGIDMVLRLLGQLHTPHLSREVRATSSTRRRRPTSRRPERPPALALQRRMVGDVDVDGTIFEPR
jgi:transcriptional regulator GlxA family with amidase domain